MTTITRRDSPVLWSLEALVDDLHQDLRGFERVEFMLDCVASQGRTLIEKMNYLQWKSQELLEEGKLPVYSDDLHEYLPRDTGDYVSLAIALQKKAADILDECSEEVRATKDWREATRTYYGNAIVFSNLLGTGNWGGLLPRVLNYA